jgi:hypothetical protein
VLPSMMKQRKMLVLVVIKCPFFFALAFKKLDVMFVYLYLFYLWSSIVCACLFIFVLVMILVICSVLLYIVL